MMTQSADNDQSNDNSGVRGPVDFVSGPVYAVEKARIALRRKHARLRPKREDDTVALCLSGGGIRSATFNLGLLQAFERRDKLRSIDYLSTVSGGGYIGSCLTWFRAMGFGFPFGTSRKDHNKTLGGGVLDWLRAHGNYLTPGDSLSSWAAAAAVITSSMVSLLIVLPLLLTLVYFLSHFNLDIPVASPLLNEFFGATDGYRTIMALGLIVGVFFFLSAVVFALLTGIRSLRSSMWNNRFRSVGGVLLFVTAALLVVGSLPYCYDFLSGERFGEWVKWSMSSITISGAVGVVGSMLNRPAGSESQGIRAFVLPGAMIVAAYGIFLWAYHFIGPTTTFPIWLQIGLLLSTLLAIVSNINHVSMHRFYRNRLMDAYMPGDLLRSDREAAAHLKKVDDEKKKKGKRPTADQFSLADIEQTSDAPYHIINTNLQTVDSKCAKLKERGGENFIMSSEYCGSEHTAWVKTSEYLGGTLNLATAMAVSGAAVDPNTYATRSRALSFMMTLLNLRLGYWTLNPSIGGFLTMRYIRRGFLNLSWYRSLFADLLGMGLTEERSIIHLSDGGHFENLGLYEMVRRECSYIVVSDASADPQRTFFDLARVLSMIRIDFGAKVEGFDLSPLNPDASTKISKSPFAVCSIEYKSGKKGRLYYIKPSMIEDLPPDIFSYFYEHGSFPHESTGDQFFDERQFEAYRELGYCLGDLFCRDAYDVETVVLDQGVST